MTPRFIHAPLSLLALTLLLTFTFASAGCGPQHCYKSPAHCVAFSYQWQGNIDETDFNEPSGAVMHPERGTLFIVGDEGDIAEFETDGTVVQNKTLRDGADFEGITAHPGTGRLYVAEEGAERIHEVTPESLAVRRTFQIERTYEGQMRMHPDGNGIEGITFLHRPDHPEGGVFIVAHQSFTLDNPEEPSALFRVEAPLRSSRAKQADARIVDMQPMPIIDMSALHYDERRDVIHALSDSHNIILTVDHNGVVTKARAFPGNDQEGLAVTENDAIFIAQDSGGVLEVQWLR